MTVSTPAYLASLYNATRAMGDKAVSSDATMVISEFEQLHLLTKQFPWPITSSMGEIEVSTPLGGMLWQAQQIKIAHQGPVSFYETRQGAMQGMFDTLVAKAGAMFNATVYEGTPDAHYRRIEIRDAFLVLDNPDRDWENRSQALIVNGTMMFHYFGESFPGNLS